MLETDGAHRGNLELLLRRKADEAAGRGDLKTARVLERAADTIRERVARVAHSYSSVRSSMPSGPERTARMDGIIAVAHNDAYAPELDQEEVLCLLWTGSEGARVWALGVLQKRPELATTRAVLEAMQRPDQMFDQYQALLHANRFVALPATGTWARKRIAEAARQLLDSGALGSDLPARNAAKRIFETALS